MANKREILEKIRTRSDHPMRLAELMHLLLIPKKDRVTFRRLLHELVRHGDLIRTRGNRYGLPQKMNLITGRLKGHRDGYGFVIPEETGQTDLYIGARNMADAMHGDKVLARVEGEKGAGRREGRILKVLERAHTQIVGRFERGRGYGFVIPSDRRIIYDFMIPPGEILGATEGMIVMADIIVYPSRNRNPEGKIVKILGDPSDPRIDTQMVIEEFHLPHSFPPDVRQEAERVADRITGSMIKGRADHRSLLTVTIDGEKARDFDDAVSLTTLPHDGFRLYVHIADVSHYVQEGSPLDREAYHRGTSVYFPDSVVPMFPERLSNGICSLNPKEDRLTQTAEISFDREGNRTGYRIYSSVIQSDERMTYTSVRQILTDRDPAVRRKYSRLVPMLEQMETLSARCYRRRIRRGSLDFDLPEPEVVLDLQGDTIDIIRGERNIGHRIIEEFMLAANEAVAEHMSRLHLPFLYRVHEEPDPDRMMAFRAFVVNFGHHVAGGEKPKPLALVDLLEAVKDRPEERLINHLLLRSMKQARYLADNRGHFGLAAPFYTHFTSPIRRYPDLIVHRLIREAGKKGTMSRTRKERWQQQLPRIALHSSERERVAMEAERESLHRRKIKFMADKTGAVYPGYISGVAAYGFFVELEPLFVEGLVRVSSLTDDFYHYRQDAHALIGEHHGRIFRIGDRVEVRVARVDLENRTIDFTLADEAPKPRARKGSPPRRHR